MQFYDVHFFQLTYCDLDWSSRYVSSDFGNHPLSHLMGSVFGMHNRENVEVCSTFFFRVVCTKHKGGVGLHTCLTPSKDGCWILGQWKSMHLMSV